MKKTGFLLSGIVGILLICLLSCPETPPVGDPTPTPTPKPSKLEAGTFWLDPETTTVHKDDTLALNVMVNTGAAKLSAYGIKISYNDAVLAPDSSAGSAVQPGADGLTTVANATTAGVLVITGFDASGKNPSLNLHLLILNFKAAASGKSKMQIVVDNLVDETYGTVGTPAGRDGTVTVQ